MSSYAKVENGLVVEEYHAATIVPWWSFTKTVISAAALVLVSENRLSLDQLVTDQSFTLRQLLRHQAGLTDYGHLADYHKAVSQGEDAWPETVMLTRTDAKKLRYDPGQSWSYSNIGYMYVRRLIEDAASESFDSALHRLVFAPLGIKSARVVRDRAELADVQMGPLNNYDPRWVYHGLIVGSLFDAAVLHHELMTGSLLSIPLLDAMKESYKLNVPSIGRPWSTPTYGLGLMMGSVATDTFMGHTGGGPGSVIAVYHMRNSQPKTTVAAFALHEQAGLIENDVVRLCMTTKESSKSCIQKSQ